MHMRKVISPRILKKQRPSFDALLLILTFVLCIVGFIMVYEASNVVAFREFGDKYYFIKDQLLWFLIGLVILGILSFFPYQRYYVLSFPLFIVTIAFLGAVFIPGIGLKVLGARRWINLGALRFQPSELAKMTTILYVSSWLSHKERGRFAAFLTLMGLTVGLVLLQPDLGTSIVLTCIFLTVYFLSGTPISHFILIIPVVAGAVIVLAIISPYRMARLTTFFDPSKDPLGASYHIRQILISLGSGGLFGVGLGASRQKFQFLPEATTDSIFAIISEELGFAGAATVVFLYFFLFTKIAKIVLNAADTQGKLLSGGILAYLGFQTLLNLSSMVALVPLTGIPLPFISYGGSNLITSMAAIGILINISRQSKKSYAN